GGQDKVTQLLPALDLCKDLWTESAPLALLARDPGGNPAKARPPEGVDARSRPKGREDLFAKAQERCLGIVWQLARKGGQKALQHLVDQVAAVRRRRISVQRVQLAQLQDSPGVESIGIAAPLLDRRDRKLLGACLQWWARLRTATRFVSFRPIQRFRPGGPARAFVVDG